MNTAKSIEETEPVTLDQVGQKITEDLNTTSFESKVSLNF